MKITTFCALTFLSLTGMAIAAPDQYIKLNDDSVYTDCEIISISNGKTKFSGKDSAGETITKEVSADEIVEMRSQSEDAQAAEETSQEGSTTETSEEEVESGTYKSLVKKQAQADAVLETIEEPSRALQSIVKSRKEKIKDSMRKLQESEAAIATLQEEYNNAGSGPFEFTVIPRNEREKYRTDGEAAYKAMLIDMKEKKNSRRIGGIDKYEIMRERYQGIPEFAAAHESYMKTLTTLERSWIKMKAEEEKKRSKLTSAKSDAMKAEDLKDYNKLERYFAETDEKIATVWFNPNKRNLRMIEHCLNKATSALRGAKDFKLDDKVGCTVDMLSSFWMGMDNVAAQMERGEIDSSLESLKGLDVYQNILSLRSNYLPSEYRQEMQEQYRAVEREITERRRTRQNASRTLERALNQKEREFNIADGLIESLINEIQRAKDVEEDKIEAERRRLEQANKKAAKKAEAADDEDEEEAEAEAASDAGKAEHKK